MLKRHPQETILARWTVDPTTWREYVRETRQPTKPGASARNVLKVSEACPARGVEVVVRDDGVFVGELSFPLSPCGALEARIDGRWLELGDSDYGFPWIVPVAPADRPEAQRIAAHFNGILEDLARAAREEYAKERARPTLNNRLLTFVENHFIAVVLIFFFVLLPLIVLSIVLIAPAFDVSE